MAQNEMSDTSSDECRCGNDCADGDCQATATNAIDFALSTIDSNLVEKRAVRESAVRLTRTGRHSAVKK